MSLRALAVAMLALVVLGAGCAPKNGPVTLRF